MANAVEETGAVEEKNEIELNHVGPIEHLTIPCPEEGGVVVLKGRNGSGKSHALDGVEALYSSKSRKGLRHRDGVPSGSINGMGVTVRLGRVNTAKGELVCESLDGRVDPSQLVDPGIKDPIKADARRLQTLIRLGNVKVAPEKWSASLAEAADKVSVSDLVDDDPILTGDRIRRRLHEVARQQEKLSESQAAESASIAKLTEEVNINAPHDDAELSKALDLATSQLARAESTRDAFANAKYKVDEANRVLESIVAVDVEPLHELVRVQNAELESMDSKMNSIAEQIRILNVELDALKQSREKQRISFEYAEKELAAANLKNADRDKFLAVSTMAMPETVSSEELEKLIAEKNAAREALKYGQTVRQAIQTRNRAEQLADESIKLAEAAKKYRDLAKSTDAVLEQALIDAGYQQIKVHDGQLCVQSDRMQLEPFSDLSHGERWAMALDMAAAGLPKGAVLPVAQEAFEALDPDNRRKLSQMAKERGLVIVTAEATDGDLRAEVLK